MAKAQRSAKNTAPEGFREVDNAMTGFWKPTSPGQTIQGIVGPMIVTKGADDKPNRFYTLRITNPERATAVQSTDGKAAADVEAGDLVGVGGALLLSFLANREGQEVYLVYKGLGEKKRGKNPAKLYTTYAKEYDPETGEIPE